MSKITEIRLAVNALIERTKMAELELQKADERLKNGDVNSGKDALWAVYHLWNSKEYIELEDLFRS